MILVAAVLACTAYFVSQGQRVAERTEGVDLLVHFSSLRNGLKPDLDLPIREHLAGLAERWHLLIPLGFMVYLLIARFSLMTIGSYSIALVYGRRLRLDHRPAQHGTDQPRQD